MRRHLPFTLLLIAAAVVGTATIIYAGQPPAEATRAVYAAWWMQALWAAVATTMAIACWRARLWRRPAVMLTHLSLLTVIAGGAVTGCTHSGGTMHLRAHHPAHSFVGSDGHIIRLPFTIELDTFRIDHYASTTVPRDYVSHLSITQPDGTATQERLSMNNVVDSHGYRLFQTSYDADLRGSIITVSHDPYGRHIVYTGFALFAIAMLWLAAQRIRHRHSTHATPAATTHTHVALLLAAAATAAVIIAAAALATTRSTTTGSQGIPCVSRAEADSMARHLVVWNGRVCPFATCATDVVLKLNGHRRPYGYTPEQVLLSWQRYPDVWNRAPMLIVKDKLLRRQLGADKGRYVAVSQLYDAERYRLQSLYDRLPDQRSKAARSIRELDERVGIVAQLIRGTLWQEPQEPPAEAHTEAELLYNRLPIVDMLFMGCLTIGLIAFVWLIADTTRRAQSKPPHATKLAATAFYFATVTATWMLAAYYTLRWHVAGEPPMAGGFESMLTIALAALLAATIVGARQPQHRLMAAAAGLTVAGFALLVAHLSQANPQLTPLMPVLRSPWLTSHVSTIMVSYALLAFTFIAALTDLITPHTHGTHTDRDTLPHNLLLAAEALLGVGIALGAVWAGRSWGTYWSWDPKEVWALITFTVYAIPLHRRMLPVLHSRHAYDIYMIAAFATVLMTYFGVNYVLGGMHSYAS